VTDPDEHRGPAKARNDTMVSSQQRCNPTLAVSTLR
jgi:hypothetical protein